MKQKFFICKHCGNIVFKVKDVGVPVICCGEKMAALEPNTSDAAGEKHLPFVTVEDGAVHVNVGEVTHPMTADHYIQWVYLETENGGQSKTLKPLDAPEVTFAVGDDDKPVAVYAYCNLHGLWKTELK